jgi:membrane-bound lytic murein transglycosylase A
MRKGFLILALIALLPACAGRQVKPKPPECNCPQASQPIEAPSPADKTKPAETPPPDATKLPDFSLLKPAKWEEIDGFTEDDLTAAWPVWLQSCTTLINKPQWQPVCAAAKAIPKPGNASIIAYFTNYFDVFSTTNADGSNTGMITGYYEPLLKGSRKKSAKYPYPLYRQPKDLITVELADIYPELKYKRVRGKLVGNKVVPYSTRADIDTNPALLAGNEIVWIDDIVDVFFLQVQGSGMVQLESGEKLQVGYADQNGYQYNSIGRLLVERGELTLDQASMQGIKAWGRDHPDKLHDLLNSNPSYVFFKELPKGLPGPLGALGVPITAERSVAVDPKFVPLGAPVFLSTTLSSSLKPLKRLMQAQDTGGAIKGGVRADFFWGAGNEAGDKAGAMKQSGKIWVLLPKGFKLN